MVPHARPRGTPSPAMTRAPESAGESAADPVLDLHALGRIGGRRDAVDPPASTGIAQRRLATLRFTSPGIDPWGAAKDLPASSGRSVPAPHPKSTHHERHDGQVQGEQRYRQYRGAVNQLRDFKWHVHSPAQGRQHFRPGARPVQAIRFDKAKHRVRNCSSRELPQACIVHVSRRVDKNLGIPGCRIQVSVLDDKGSHPMHIVVNQSQQPGRRKQDHDTLQTLDDCDEANGPRRSHRR